MAIKFISAKCPDCGATLEIEEGRKQIFCSYCGAKVIINNENEYTINHIHKQIDETEIKRIEAEKELESKKIALEEKAYIAKQKRRKIQLIIGGVVGVFAVLMGFILSINGNYIGYFVIMYGVLAAILIAVCPPINEHFEGQKQIPNSINDFTFKNYEAIETIFKSAGFTNVKTVPLNDIRIGLFVKPGYVESITVDGKTIEQGGQYFYPYVPVVISYHTRAKEEK